MVLEVTFVSEIC